MLKKILGKINPALDKLDEAIGLKVTPSVRLQLETDLSSLGIYLDGDNGFIDYYSLKAKDQLDYQKKTLDQYIDILTVLQATLICIDKKQKELDDIENQPLRANVKLTPIKKAMDSLKHINSIKALRTRKDVSKEVKKIQDIDRLKKEHYEVDKKLKIADTTDEDDEKISAEARQRLVDKKRELEGKINHFNDEVHGVEGFAEITKGKTTLLTSLDKHEILTEKIPEGMLDVKRALCFQQELRVLQKKIEYKKNELSQLAEGDSRRVALASEIEKLEEQAQLTPTIKFSTSEAVDHKIKAMLDDLRGLMASSIKGYQDLIVAGGDYNAFLHKTTAFYWESLYLYRETLSAVNDYCMAASDLTDEGKLVVKCINNAFKQAPKQEAIHFALKKVKDVDKDLKKREKSYNAEKSPPVRFYKNLAATFVDSLLTKQEGKFCFIPYNANSYVLDHPAGTDLAGALGNCFGETQMFLLRINAKEPTFNNICPERALLNFQLDQSRKVFGANSSPKELGKFEVRSTDSEKVGWDTIKNFLIKDVDSKHHGDICLMKLKGATVPGHHTEVGHAIGFIKMKNPTPYKYVVYDYNMGAMGFSDDVQLELFIKKIFDTENGGYYPFSKCVFEKVGEVSDECQQLINGPAGIQPLEKTGLSTTCERRYWDAYRLVLLAKYCSAENQQSGIKLILEKVKTLPADGDKEKVYSAIFANKQFGLEQLFALSISDHPEFLESVLRQEPLLSEGLSYKDKLSLVTEKTVVNLVRDGQVTADVACRVFSHNAAIVLAAYHKNDTSLQFADKYLVVSLIHHGKVQPNKACRVFSKDGDVVLAAYKVQPGSLVFAERSVVVTLVKQGKFKAKDLAFVCQSFSEDEGVVLAAYKASNYNPMMLQSAHRQVVATLLERGKLKDKDFERVCSAFSTDEELVLAAYKASNQNPNVLKFANSVLVNTLIKKGEVTLAEETRLAEEARLAEETRLAEAARLAEAVRLAEKNRLTEMARLAEATGVAPLKDAAVVAVVSPIHDVAPLGESVMQQMNMGDLHYKPASTTTSRRHAFTAITDLPNLSSYKGDVLKTKILFDVKQLLLKITDRCTLEQAVNDFMATKEYKILRTGQGFTTRFFNLKTDSVKAFELICQDVRKSLASVGKHPTDHQEKASHFNQVNLAINNDGDESVVEKNPTLTR